LLRNNFVFPQDGDTGTWCDANARVASRSFAPKSPDLNPLGYYVWSAMLEEFSKLNRKPQNITELKIVLQMILDKLPDETIRKAIIGYRKQLNAYVSAGGAHFEPIVNCFKVKVPLLIASKDCTDS